MVEFAAVRLENGIAALFSCFSYSFATILFGAILIGIWVVNKKPTAVRICESDAEEDAREPFLEKKVYLFGGLVGAVCASIVFFTTILSRTVSIIILNTVPNAICLTGSLVIDFVAFKSGVTVRQIIGVILNIVATAIIVIL